MGINGLPEPANCKPHPVQSTQRVNRQSRVLNGPLSEEKSEVKCLHYENNFPKFAEMDRECEAPGR